MAKETYLDGKRDLSRRTWMAKDPYFDVKRYILLALVSKETYLDGKRYILRCQKIPTSMSKMTYF